MKFYFIIFFNDVFKSIFEFKHKFDNFLYANNNNDKKTINNLINGSLL